MGFEQFAKETLRQILRVVRAIAAPPDKAVNGRPIARAQILQRLARRRGLIPFRQQDLGPAGFREPLPAPRAVGLA